MLSLDEHTRPDAMQVTEKLQMLAIAAVVEDITRFLRSLVQREKSLDAQIELWRF